MSAAPTPAHRHRFEPGQWIVWLLLLVIFVVMAYPFFYVMSLAVMPYENYVSQSVHAGPSGFTLDYFRDVLSDPRIAHAFQMSIAKTVVGTILNVLATSLCAYALSRPNLRFGRLLSLLFLVPLFATGGLIPYYLTIKYVGLLNTFWALVLPHLVSPFYFFVMRAYFRDYPQEVIEAARMDGAGHFRIFWQIIWPTSRPIIATMTLLYATAHWNDYYWPSILVRQDLQPATVVLQQITTSNSVLSNLGLGSQLTPQSYVAAVAAVLIIPVLLFYPFIQRHLVRGIMLGSVKG